MNDEKDAEMKQYGISFHVKMWEKMRALAKKNDRSASAEMRIAAEKHLADNEADA